MGNLTLKESSPCNYDMEIRKAGSETTEEATVETRSFLQILGGAKRGGSCSRVCVDIRTDSKLFQALIYGAFCILFHPKGADLGSVVCSSVKKGRINMFQGQKTAKQTSAAC